MDIDTMDFDTLNRLLKGATPSGAYLLGVLHSKMLSSGAAISNEFQERAVKCPNKASAEALYREMFPGEELLVP